jgi:hypothetical protein
MCVQEYIAFDHYVRTYTIGKKDVWPMPYDPILHRYLVVPDYLDKETDERCRRDAITICEALGYDINTVEFAVKDGVPYAIDYMNPAPDADWWSVGSVYFEWLVQKVADLAIDQALHGESTVLQHRWDDLLHHEIVRGESATAGAGTSEALVATPNAALVATPSEALAELSLTEPAFGVEDAGGAASATPVEAAAETAENAGAADVTLVEGTAPAETDGSSLEPSDSGDTRAAGREE